MERSASIKYMKEHIANLVSPSEIVKTIFHDNKEIIDEFAKHFSSEILEFSEHYATAYKKYLELNRLVDKTENKQIAHVGAFTYLMLDSLLLSMKLFVLGYVIPSGNLMRQVVESVALTCLCSANDEIFIKKIKKKLKSISTHIF